MVLRSQIKTNIWIYNITERSSVLSSESLLVIISEQLVQEIQGLGTDEVLALAVHKPLPSLTRVSP